tara:strand:+ start:165767 stop:166099 length:333 start_codon:yes stop_codon:yes gene_type:complete
MNYFTLPPEQLPDALAESGMQAVKLADGREWVHPEHLGSVYAGVKHGREDDFTMAIASMHDDGTRRLIAEVGKRGLRTAEFNAALVEWVRERLTLGLPIPDSVHKEWHPK